MKPTPTHTFNAPQRLLSLLISAFSPQQEGLSLFTHKDVSEGLGRVVSESLRDVVWKKLTAGFWWGGLGILGLDEKTLNIRNKPSWGKLTAGFYYNA